VTLPMVVASSAAVATPGLSQGPLEWKGSHANLESPVTGVFGIGRDLFAVGPGALNQSHDGGKEWTHGPPGGTAIWGASMDELWIAGSGVIRSTDRAQTWHRMSVPASTRFETIGGRASDVIAGGIGALVHSTDHGATWTPIQHGITDATFIAIATSGAETFVVGREQVKDPASSIGYHTESIILRSRDGTTYERLAAPKPGMTDNEESRGVCFTASGKLLLAMSYSVFASTDRGATWARATEVGTEVLGLACHGKEVMTVGRNKRFLRSTDDGTTWSSHDLDTVLPGAELIALNGVWIGADGTALVSGESYSKEGGGTLLVRAR